MFGASPDIWREAVPWAHSMAGNNQKTRKAILGELESIKELLQDEAEIPLLDDTIEIPPAARSTKRQSGAASPNPTNPEKPAASGAKTRAATEVPDETDVEAEEVDIPVLDQIIPDPDASDKQPATAPRADTQVTHANAGSASAPAQQQLFGESGETRQSPQHTGSARSSAVSKPNNSARKEPSTTASKTDENPFLPKHIRERLHTNKKLVDVIKASHTADKTAPSASSATTQKKNPLTGDTPTAEEALIEELVAEFIPKIETELRRRLENLLNPSGTNDHQQQNQHDPNS